MTDSSPVPSNPPAAPQRSTGVPLPGTARARLNGELDGQSIVAWALYDLDEKNAYAEHYVIVTEDKFIVLAGGPPQTFAIKDIAEAKITEGLGVDRLTLLIGDATAIELHYTRRQRRDMTRLHRKLERRLAMSAGKEAPPEWLEVVEREAEQKEQCPKCGMTIPAYAEGVCPRCLQRRRILWRLLDVAKPYRPRLMFALAMTVLVAAVSIVPSYITKVMVDHAIDPKTRDSLGKMVSAVMPIHERLRNLGLTCILFVVVVAVHELLGSMRLRTLSIIGTQVTADLREMVYAHMHELSLRYFSKRRTGSLITRVTSDTDRLWDFIVFGSVDLIRNLAMIVAIGVIMFVSNWRLAIIALIPLPGLAVLTYKRGIKMQTMFGRLWTYWSRMTAVVGDAIPGVRVVKAFANEKREVDRFNRRSHEYTSKEQEIHVIWTTLQPLVSGSMRMGALLIWLVGGYLLITDTQGRYTMGTLVMFTGLNAMFYGPIMDLANSNRMVTRAASSAQRIFEVLDTPPEIYSRNGAFKKEKLEGRVEFRQVSFSYEGAQPALREVSMMAEPGQMIGLCGSSGAGKSTFVNLICRFYDVTDGQLLLDGVDIREYDVHWLRRQIGMVLQEPYLFHGTIAENIRYGNPDATAMEVITAAKAANAHDFIVAMPDGYDTMVGERGQSLSGGERQRVSIARAILHNPRILILDEATSSVDTETEKQIQQALDHLVEGRTTFAIAHRLTTLSNADRLIVLEKGKIVEQGTHSELVGKENGAYARLNKIQLEMQSAVYA